jgi:hypothetical protein
MTNFTFAPQVQHVAEALRQARSKFPAGDQDDISAMDKRNRLLPLKDSDMFDRMAWRV